MNKTEMKRFIVNELNKFSFNRYTKGFRYLCETIFICINDEEKMNNLSKNVYPIIAKKHKEKNSTKIKWCIEQVLKTMYNNTDNRIICNYFSIQENKKPSIKLVVYTIVCKYEWSNFNNN